MILVAWSSLVTTNWSMVLLTLISLVILTGLMIAYNRYAGTGGRYDPAILLRKYGWALVLLLVIGFGYINLDHYCTFNISMDKPNYSVGEIIEANFTIRNPLPIPVYYRGYSEITVKTAYTNGTKIQRADLPLARAWAEEAAEAARAASGAIVGGGFIGPHGEKRIKSVWYRPDKVGEALVMVNYERFNRVMGSELGFNVTNYDPVEVNIESDGVRLFLDESDDIDTPVIVIKVENMNPYPVRLPVFNKIGTRHENQGNETSYEAQIFWGIFYWDIQAYSNETIYRTQAYASDTRTPIYFTLYDKTLRYPPE